MPSRPFRHWLLALTLLLAQWLAGTHAFAHAGEGADEGLGHAPHCALCLVAADLSGAAPAPQTALPRLAAPPVQAGDRPCVPARAQRLGLPPARAPPASD